MVKKNNNIVFLIIFSSIIIFGTSFVFAASCWQYNSVASGCTAANGCLFRNDSWGSWCEELSCWSLYNQSDCTTKNIPGKNCTWQGGSGSYSCDEISCWSYSGTNSSTCEVNSQNKSCTWSPSCYSTGGATGCYDLTTSDACNNATGCAWGQCHDKGCNSYSTEGTCNAGLDFNSNNCTWSGSYCKEKTCYDSIVYPNKTACNDATGISCEWKFGSCQEKGCYSFDYTNETACVNNTIGETCTWSGSYCNSDSCWSASTNSSCQLKNSCQWVEWTSSGWCEEVNCWTYDSFNGNNQSDCENNIYQLNCLWSGNPPGNLTSGYCFEDFTSTSCSNVTTEKECYDTNYCWWQANNWNNPLAGGNCSDPNWGSIDNVNSSILNDWNPGCYIFDTNSTKCNNVLGCNYTTSTGTCDELPDSNGTQITADGIGCLQINESQLCNNIPSLNSCCSWQNSTCQKNQHSTTCISQLDQTPNGEVSCEDAKTSSNCQKISGDPWYMPCKWTNSTKKCEFKASQVFGNTSFSIVKIENDRNCKAAGGKWITENYCEGTVAVPTGRCEYKFDDETNCDKACFACEKNDRNGNTVNATNARDSCVGSKLGFCEFTSNTGAPNGIGYCKAKDQYKKGLAGDCDLACGDCNFLGDPKSNSTRDSSSNCLHPSCYCTESDANSAGGGCKWITDNSTTTGGYCLQKGAKTCVDSCDRCKTRNKCANDGRSALNSSGSCKWQGTDSDGSCVANVAGDVEICWDGIDNNANDLIDCADAGCYSDPWCGFVQGDCFGWTDNTTCRNNDCEWVNDTWNPAGWCDFKGSQCWQNDKSQNSCSGLVQVNETLNISAARIAGNDINGSINFALANNINGWLTGSVTIQTVNGTNMTGNFSVDYVNSVINFTNGTFMVQGDGGHFNNTNVSYQYYSSSVKKNCEWNAGTGGGWCERDWSVAEECFSASTFGTCFGINTTDGKNCTWTNDTWCDGFGVGSDWCTGNGGGWCDHNDFKPLDCWQYSENVSCSETTGCDWQVDTWSQSTCEVNWSGNCWSNFDNSTCESAGCWWRNETFGGQNSAWCSNKFDQCWNQYTSGGCGAVTDVNCTWRAYGGGGGTCEPSCYNSTSSSQCTTNDGCIWREESGWCTEQQSETCYNNTNSGTEANCVASSGCTWKNPGWCDPKEGGFSGGAVAGGGGVGGALGAECYKYDGNQTMCTNTTLINITCGWFPEPNPRCDVDWSGECWQYTTAGNCNGDSGCWWNPEGFGGGYCGNVADQCWSNLTLTQNTTACNENANCNSTGFGCEPTCFAAASNTESTCSASICKWTTGWCNPGGMNDLFDDIESGAPLPLGFDTCGPFAGEPNQTSVDICGFGMKDMGDGFGFGINVFDFSNSSTCNKEKISSHVFESFGGFGGGAGADRIGSGNDTVIFFVYLDTDASTTGGCSLSHNSSADGYEFRFRYSSEWNASKQKAIENYNAYKCDNSKWVATDIKLSAWKKLMCSEIGGAMIAVEKTDLTRFPTLYDSTADMRIYVATIGDASTGNVSSPTDTAGPGWTTPGTIDFEISSCFDYGADTAKFEDILKKGFIQGEDCFTAIDDDNDGSTNCDDWDCQFSSQCTSTGVNAAGYVDTSTPQVTGVRIEEYPDSALILYDTNKPSNGTLQFYKNDSRCLTLNATVKDIGLTSDYMRNYSLGHKAEVYDSNIGYVLTNDTKYYYKLKVCDDANKCALSKCSSFVTAPKSKCGFCDFVARIKEPTGWSVSFDANQDGTWEHGQGLVCGPNAGLKMNYTLGRRVNIKLNNSDDSNYFLFLNASLTKTGLNDKVRTISDHGSIINTSNYVGLDSSTRDKIINNLQPERCRVKIPFGGTCDSLFHCDDTGGNCVDRTSTATLIDSTNCVWEVPFCEFSTYRESTTDISSGTGGDSGSSGGSSGGGGGGVITTTATDDDDETEDEGDDEGAISPPTPTEERDEGDKGKTQPKEDTKRGNEGTGVFLWIVVVLALIGGVAAVLYGVWYRNRKKWGFI